MKTKGLSLAEACNSGRKVKRPEWPQYCELFLWEFFGIDYEEPLRVYDKLRNGEEDNT